MTTPPDPGRGRSARMTAFGRPEAAAAQAVPPSIDSDALPARVRHAGVQFEDLSGKRRRIVRRPAHAPSRPQSLRRGGEEPRWREGSAASAAMTGRETLGQEEEASPIIAPDDNTLREAGCESGRRADGEPGPLERALQLKERQDTNSDTAEDLRDQLCYA